VGVSRFRLGYGAGCSRRSCQCQCQNRRRCGITAGWEPGFGVGTIVLPWPRAVPLPPFQSVHGRSSTGGTIRTACDDMSLCPSMWTYYSYARTATLDTAVAVRDEPQKVRYGAARLSKVSLQPDDGPIGWRPSSRRPGTQDLPSAGGFPKSIASPPEEAHTHTKGDQVSVTRPCLAFRHRVAQVL
jgi:hypothetical protein